MANSLRVDANFRADPIAEYQYFGVFRAAAIVPEEQLLAAVLNDAVECLAKYQGDKGRRGHTLYREARDWILREEADDVFAFEYICEALKLDANYLRSGLLRRFGDSRAQSERVKLRRPPLRYRNRIRCLQVAS